MSTPTDFRAWCAAYGCRTSLYIGSLDFQAHRVHWSSLGPGWNGSDLNHTFFDEFGYIGTGNPAALPAGFDPALLSKGTTASAHANGPSAQLVLQHVLGPAAFGLPSDYVFTYQDGQRAVTLEDPHQQGVCLWDGVIRAMLLAKAPAPPPKPTPAPIPAPAPAPTPPPAGSALPPLTPAGHRVIEIERIVVQFAIRLLPATYDSLPATPEDLAACLQTSLVPLRFVTIPLLKTWRRAAAATGDPRPLPLEDL